MIFRKAVTATAFLAVFSSLAWAKDKDKDAGAQNVDSGSFGIFMSGRRVATETFSIKQGPGGSVVTSEFRADAASGSSIQDSELQISSTGELQKYEWREISPGKSQAVVSLNDSFLIEKIATNPAEKAIEKPFMLPASTSILDDYFFVQREVLAWKFLTADCRQQNGSLECLRNQKVQFGTLNPHAQSSMSVSMEFAGKDNIELRGSERQLSRFILKTENGDWTLWLDDKDQFKLMRVLIASDNTEVVRD